MVVVGALLSSPNQQSDPPHRLRRILPAVNYFMAPAAKSLVHDRFFFFGEVGFSLVRRIAFPDVTVLSKCLVFTRLRYLHTRFSAQENSTSP